MEVKHLLGLDQFSRQEVEDILARTGELKEQLKEGKARPSLAGKSVAMIFEKASTRTRVSFEVGINQLGAMPLFLPGHHLQLARGEPIKDTARVLSRYIDAVVIRAKSHKDMVEFAQWSKVPVINGLTDLLHPCQILADLFSIREAGADLDRIKIAFIGDGNNVANSWINAATIFNFRLDLACPQGYDPDHAILDAARKKEAEIHIQRDPAQAAKDADVLYTDVWVSMGQEEEMQKRMEAFKGFQVNGEMIDLANRGVKVMHCLPAHRGEEISEEAMEGQNSIIFEQAENRLHVQKAILEILMIKSE